MLLWLTIAVLGIPSCWAGPIYGKGGGKYFSTVNNENDITAIRVCLDVFGVMKSINLRFGSYWTGKYGSSLGKCEQVNLHAGEHIIQIHGTYNHFLRSLVLHTDEKRQITFGKNIGYTFHAFPQTKGQVLTGVFGHYMLTGLISLGFTWEFPLVKTTAAPKATTKKSVAPEVVPKATTAAGTTIKATTAGTTTKATTTAGTTTKATTAAPETTTETTAAPETTTETTATPEAATETTAALETTTEAAIAPEVTSEAATTPEGTTETTAAPETTS